MTEKNLIVNNRLITYKGLFRVHELFDTINQALEELGYQKQEKKTEERVAPSGRKTYIELRPFKVKTNYVTLMLKIKVSLDNVTEVTKEVDHVPKTFQQGEIDIALDAWSLTDYASRWGMKPWVFFLKAFISRYIYHFPLESSFINELKADAARLIEQIKALLSLYKYQVSSSEGSSKEDSLPSSEAEEL